MDAACQCGEISARISGPGDGVICHCKACQRRTGSPFGMMVYFEANAVQLTGEATEYTRTADSGDDVTHGFCPNCGTPFYLRTAKHPGGIGIAVGVLDEPASDAPVRSVFEENKLSWIAVPETTQRFPRGRNG